MSNTKTGQATPIDSDNEVDTPKAQGEHYKIRLASSRVIGPLDIERIKIFIFKNKISGNEVARLYPSGTWKDINQFPEIAELILQHLEGKLEVSSDSNSAVIEESAVNDAVVATETSDKVSVIDLEKEEKSPISVQERTQVIAPEKVTPLSRDEEGTMVISRDTEGTQVVDLSLEEVHSPSPLNEAPSPVVDEDLEVVSVKYSNLSDIGSVGAGTNLSEERTVLLKIPPKMKEDSEPNGLKKILRSKLVVVLVVTLALLAIVDIIAPEKKTPNSSQKEIPFSVAFPVVDKGKADPQQSEILYKSALSYYNLDTVDGYKNATGLLAKSVTLNGQNVKAIALLASCYINLFDVVTRDENYFQVVTGLVQAARAKQVEVAELVVTDVELFNLMSNPDAAILRLDEYSKRQVSGSSHFPQELFYYLALSYYYKGNLEDALKNLDLLPEQAWFSARIPYLYGLLFEKTNRLEQAVAAFEKVIKASPNHLKARIHLADVLVKKDSIAAAGTQAEYVINHSNLASESEKARAHYIRGRMLGSVSRNQEALTDLEKAKKYDPENIDVLYEYYTIKARVAQSSKENINQISSYQQIAKGELAFKKLDLPGAMRAYLEARRIDETNPQPLLRIAEIFKRQGNYVGAINNYNKAIKLAPARADLYPAYIRLAIDSYEFEIAKKSIEKYIKMNPSPSSSEIDSLYGYLYYKSSAYGEAALFLKRALQGAALNVSIYIQYADILLGAGKFADAAFYYGLARRVDPLNTEARIGIAKALAETESIDNAVDYIDEQIKLDETNKTILLAGLAEIYLRKNNSPKALKAIDSALEIDSKYARAVKIKGDILQSMDKFKEAETQYSSYQSMNPNDPASYIERYRMSIKRRDYVGARREINGLIARFPKFPGGHYMLGDVALQAQNAKEAFREAELELANNPNYVPALVLAGNALNLAREYVPALQRFNTALALDPMYVPALIGAGFANHMLKTYPAAQTMLERAAKIDTGNPNVKKRLGSLYFDMGNTAAAKQQFQMYLDLYPDAPDRVEIEKILQ